MKLSMLCLVILLLKHGLCKTDIFTGHNITVEVPMEYSEGFIGRAFLIETNQTAPNFRAALSVEAVDGKYSCSLQVFLGEVKVWNSGHYSKFYTTEKCVLELTEDGDLRLKGPKERVGWRAGTSKQGVERLRILGTGNLALTDALGSIKWQTFNFPTDVMLWGQSLNVATRLTSFPNNNSTTFFSFEIQNDKIALYLHYGKLKYSYWDFKPSKNRNITYIKLGSKGLALFNDKSKKIAEIKPSQVIQPLSFLALGNRTGNLGLYFYSPEKSTFEASFQALNTTCDLPLACKPYGICTFSNACSCVTPNSDCSEGISEGFCGKAEMKMLELEGISTILRDGSKRVNVSKEECANLCLEDCECVAVLHSSAEKQECFAYSLVMGVKQIEKRSAWSYMVKVPKDYRPGHGKSELKKWILVVVCVVDGFIILLVLGGLGFYLIHRRRKNLLRDDNET